MNSNRMGETLTRPGMARGCDPRARHAFTLLEVLVTIAIIGLLATLAIMNLGGVHRRAEETAARLMVNETMKTALQTYRFSMGELPSTAEGLPALLTAPGAKSKWSGPYIERLPPDPWGEPYQYASPGQHSKAGYDVWSKGPDKLSGTADDIGNWETKSP